MSRKPTTHPTITTRGGSGGRRSTERSIVTAFLEEATGKIHIIPESDRPLSMGRAADDDIVIADLHVSRKHALVELLPDRVVIRAWKTMTVNGIVVAEAHIRPGDRFTLRGVSFLALNSGMVLAYPHLDRLVGERTTVLDLLRMPATSHAVLLGVRHAPLYEVARVQHAAIAGTSAFVEATTGRPLRGVEDIATVLPSAVNARVYVEGRRRDEKGRDFTPRLGAELLDQLAGARQRTALTVALSDLAEVHRNLLRRGARVFVVPSVADRLKSADAAARAHIIDTTFAHLVAPWRARDLHPDFMKALVSSLWVTGDYVAFAAILHYAHHAWTGARDPAERLFARHPRQLVRWLEELGFDWTRLRELMPSDAR